MILIYICIGILIGLFIPSPFDSQIRTAVSNIWNKIVNKSKS